MDGHPPGWPVQPFQLPWSSPDVSCLPPCLPISGWQVIFLAYTQTRSEIYVSLCNDWGYLSPVLSSWGWWLLFSAVLVTVCPWLLRLLLGPDWHSGPSSFQTGTCLEGGRHLSAHLLLSQGTWWPGERLTKQPLGYLFPTKRRIQMLSLSLRWKHIFQWHFQENSLSFL